MFAHLVPLLLLLGFALTLWLPNRIDRWRQKWPWRDRWTALRRPIWIVSLLYGSFLLTMLTYGVINWYATRSAHQLLATAYVNDHGMIAFPDQFDGPPEEGKLDKRKLGAERDDLPEVLQRSTNPKEGWRKLKPEEADDLANRMLSSEVPEGFDRLFMQYLSFNLIAMRKEKPLREEQFSRVRVNAEGKSVADNEGTTLLEYLDTLTDKERTHVTRHFGNFYSNAANSMGFWIARKFNGWIQFWTVWAFWAAIMILVKNFWWNVLMERNAAVAYCLDNAWHELVWSGSRDQGGLYPFSTEAECLLERRREMDSTVWDAAGNLLLRGLWGDNGEQSSLVYPPAGVSGTKATSPTRRFQETYVFTALRSIYLLYLRYTNEINARHIGTNRSLLYDLLDRMTQHRIKQLDSNMATLVYLAWSIPSLGFIGTVIGIGNALLGAPDMMTPNQDLQKNAVQAITIELGFAFDTTLVALLLSLVLMLLIYLERRAEERWVLYVQHKIVHDLINRVL